MRKAKILDKAETKNHEERWTFMIGLGRDSRSDQRLAKTLCELACSEVHYEKVLALMSAHGSFEKEIIVRLLKDPSTTGMGAAVKLAVRHLDTEQLTDIIPGLSKGKRQRMIMALLGKGRIDVLEHVYTKLCLSEQRDMLCFTSEKFFREHLERDRMEGFSENQWRLIARRFPSLAYKRIKEILSKSAKPSWLVQQAVSEVLRQFYKTSPEIGLLLQSDAIDHIHTRYLHLEKYAHLFPDAVIGLILKQPEQLSVSLPPIVLRKLNNETLCSLVDKGILVNVQNIFPKLRPQQRTALYQWNAQSLRDTNGALPLGYIKALPGPARAKEALHAFHLKMLEARPMDRLSYLSVLPFKQGAELAAAFLNQPEGELRALAVSALVQSGRYHSAEMDQILDFCLKRENEQDPVRQAMMKALAGLPAGRWVEEHLPKLREIIAAAMRARDCSYQTMAAAADLLLKMLTQQTDFVCSELPVLVERMGRLSVPSLESRITNMDLVKLDTHLFPVMRTWIARDRSHFAISFITGFGCRFKSFYKMHRNESKPLGFVQLLIDLTQDKRGHIARSGLETLDRLSLKKEVSGLIPQLLKQDVSWIQVNCVSQYLHRHRQDLLTPFLNANVYKNRFGSGNTAILPAFHNGFVRWTLNQQQIYAASLNKIINGGRRNAWELYQCVNRMSAMPSVDLAPLRRLAADDAKDIALRDKVLEALGRADAGRGVATLLQALVDSRARIAIYALRRSILEMPAKNALELLSKAPRNKVTVIKEIIRLTGEFDGEEVYHFLMSFAEDETLHPDVQIALLRAFWKYLSYEDVWTYFHAAAKSGHAALARSTIRIPQEGLSLAGREHLCTQLTLLLKNENAQVRIEALKRLVYMPLGNTNDEMFEVLTGILEDIDVNICRLAAEAMLNAYVSQNQGKLIDAFSQVKRPRSVAAIVDAFQSQNSAEHSERETCAKSLSLAILKQGRLPSQALRLAITLLSPSDMLSILEYAEKAGLLHPGVVWANLNSFHRPVKIYSQQVMAELEVKLSTAQSAALRRLGLGLLMETSRHYGWTKENREKLDKYCVDVDLWISETAGLIELPQDLE